MAKVISAAPVAVLLTLCLPAAPAQAQLSRTFVSAAVGNDANNCDRPTPCRTFQRAHDNTFDQGEITVLDPGGYGAVTITKSIAIVNDGVGEAGVLVSGGVTGIVINGNASAYVSLRGLTIQGIGFGGGRGILFSSGFALTIENCVVRNHTGDAIGFQPNASANLSVSNTVVADNGGNGITIGPTGSGNAKVSLRGVESYNNSHDAFFVAGLFSTGSVNVAVADSAAANNGFYGFRALSEAGKAATNLMVVHSMTANNFAGLFAQGANATIWLGQSTVTGNANSWLNSGTLLSFGDNYIAGNADGDKAPPTIAKK